MCENQEPNPAFPVKNSNKNYQMFFFVPQKVTAAQRSVQPADPAADQETPAEKGKLTLATGLMGNVVNSIQPAM